MCPDSYVLFFIDYLGDVFVGEECSSAWGDVAWDHVFVDPVADCLWGDSDLFR